MRGRKPKPTAIKQLDGTRKSRINTEEPKFIPDTDSIAPEFLDEYGKLEWNRIYPEVSEKGVLTKVDRMVLVGYCEAYAEYRRAKEVLDKYKSHVFKTPNGAIQPSPYVSIKRNALQLMLKFAVELGITPSARSRIKAESGGDDPDVNFLFGKKGEKKCKA